ncbi:hypothetical protein LBLM1_05010 [Limosilactobacillus mucosae LM1]|jgi:Na+/melibiose symporter-like transporter|uniref:Uncharacterized protein n=4 Tax=Limosilactobacillus mucosae TaxID=97478 RepID=A0A0D4CJY0_LIMMU|nr:hypothetical protein LBLM1_05010 [Limosilactobacillus mucosae LM1]KRL25938.1 hypothetical protein FC47_GL001978 [Limosilactobacillus mucosae DSM 13345]
MVIIMMTLLTAFHPAHAFWIGLLIVLAIIALMNLICWLLPPKKRPSKHPTQSHSKLKQN